MTIALGAVTGVFIFKNCLVKKHGIKISLFTTGLTGLVIFLAKSHLSNFVQRVSIWKPLKSGVPFAEPCDSFVEEAVWEVNIPHAISQGQKVLTSVDINKDSIEDIILGFDSGLRMICV